MLEFARTSPVTLVLSVPSGVIEVVAEPRDSATVDIEPYDGRDVSREVAEQTEVDLSGDTLRVIAPRHSGGLLNRGGSIRARIAVPRDSSAKIETGSADTACRGTYATLSLDGASSDVQVEHVTGEARIKTASGDVRVGRIDGALTLGCASGDATVRQVAGPAQIDAASGDVVVEEAGGDVRARTASGDVQIGVVSRGTVRVDTSSGDVGVGVRAGTGVWLDLSTASGTTRNGLAMADGPTGGTNGQHLRLEVHTASGDIKIRRVA